MPIPAEVNTFQTEIGRDQGILSRPTTQYGAVVANSGEHDAPWGAGTHARQPSRLSHASNLGNQRFFSKRHGRNYYTSQRWYRPISSSSCYKLGRTPQVP